MTRFGDWHGALAAVARVPTCSILARDQAIQRLAFKRGRRIGFDVPRETTAGFAEPGFMKRVGLTAIVECTWSPGMCAVRHSHCSSPRMLS